MSILFVTATHIGDAILSSGLLARLLADYPEDDVTIACGGPAASVFQAVPRLQAIHAIRKQKYHRHWFDLWKKVAGRRWRVVADLRRSLLPWMVRAGHRYTIPGDRGDRHRVVLIGEAMGLPPQDPVIWTTQAHRREADALLGDTDNLLAVAPGANWSGKMWPAERFADLTDRLTRPGGLVAGARVVLIGAGSERSTGDATRQRLGSDGIIDAFGTDVLTTHEILRRCRLMVGNDSAMMHLAAASGIPTAGLFGPSRDDLYAPWGDNGLVIRTPESKAALTGQPDFDHKTTDSLMVGLSVAQVETALRETWGDQL